MVVTMLLHWVRCFNPSPRVLSSRSWECCVPALCCAAESVTFHMSLSSRKVPTHNSEDLSLQPLTHSLLWSTCLCENKTWKQMNSKYKLHYKTPATSHRRCSFYLPLLPPNPLFFWFGGNIGAWGAWPQSNMSLCGVQCPQASVLSVCTMCTAVISWNVG